MFKKIKSIFKGKEKEKKKSKQKQPEKKSGAQKTPVKPSPKKILTETNTILNAPHISEKATRLTDQNKYVFKISFRANKIQAKQAIENIYGVKVEKINIINVPRKNKAFQGIQGFKSGYKKAIVSLAKGESIEMVSG